MPAMVPLIWPDDIVLRRNERFRSSPNSCQNMSSQLQIFSEIHQFTFLEKSPPPPKCWGGAHRPGGPIWIFAESRFTFSLGSGVDHVPGHHKPQKWTIQTHSFSEHPKIFESTKSKYIFGSMEVDEKSKNSENSAAWLISDTYQDVCRATWSKSCSYR